MLPCKGPLLIIEEKECLLETFALDKVFPLTAGMPKIKVDMTCEREGGAPSNCPNKVFNFSHRSS